VLLDVVLSLVEVMYSRTRGYSVTEAKIGK
jgi:hypothetical protein